MSAYNIKNLLTALTSRFRWSIPANIAIAVLVTATVASAQSRWTLGPFAKVDSANPCLHPGLASHFVCPVRGTAVGWEAKDVFNPAAVVHEGKVHLLYRAQDSIGKPFGTSRIGLAWSADGTIFRKHSAPVLYPDNDFMKIYEWEGGCEDPRIVLKGEGGYVMTYTAYDGRLARLAIATSSDLVHWEKKGLAFDRAMDGKYRDTWSKSGSIVTEKRGDSLVAVRIGGLYWMYWGESNIFLATSEDLIRWTPLETGDGHLAVALMTRDHSFDSRLVEPGPPALLTEAGILLIYNSCNDTKEGDPGLPSGTYSAGQALFSREDPRKLVDRTASYFFHPEKKYELVGQVNSVCFLEGLVHFKGHWFLYYGTADSRIAVAVNTP